MPSGLHIRPYRSGDETSVLDLWKSCGLIVSHNDPRKDIRRKLKVNPEWFLVGEQNQQLIATCMAGYEGHRGWINYLAVSPVKQRQGIEFYRSIGFKIDEVTSMGKRLEVDESV